MRFRVGIVAVAMTVVTMAGQSAAVADDDDGYYGADNIVEVRNTRDNSLRARSRAVVTHTSDRTVDNTNVASAWATCFNCRTAAAAVQVVIVEGPYDPPLVPENGAVAINDVCDTCVTFAYARQTVFVVGHLVRIRDRAEDRIEDINEDMSDLIRSGLPLPTLEVRLDALNQELVDVVQGEIDRSGRSGGKHDRRQVDDD